MASRGQPTLPANRADLTHLVMYAERGKPKVLPNRVGSRKANQWDGGYRNAEKAKVSR